MKSMSMEKILWIFAAVLGMSLLMFCVVVISQIQVQLNTLGWELERLSHEVEYIGSTCNSQLADIGYQVSMIDGNLNVLDARISDMDRDLLNIEQRLADIESDLQYLGSRSYYR